MRDSGAPSDLGGWAADELADTVHEASLAGADHDSEQVVRFVRGVAGLVRKREALDPEREDPKEISVFLLNPAGENLSDLPNHPMLDNGLTPLAGKVWHVNAAVVSGKSADLNATDDDAAFRVVTEELSLGSVPAVIVDPRFEETEVRFYRTGLSNPDDREMVRLVQNTVTVPELSAVIDGIHRQILVTPDGQPPGNKLWKDGSRHYPKRDAEHGVQAFLKPAFVTEFKTCRVYDEFAGTMGRADIHIEQPDPLDRSRVTFLAVLELKVLRSYSEGGSRKPKSDNDSAVDAGVRQAASYRDERGHQVAVLCCFDMRESDEGDACFDAVRGLAEEHHVALRRWYLYGTSKEYRDALTS